MTIKFKEKFEAIAAIESNEIKINYILDFPEEKKAIANFKIVIEKDFLNREEILWQGDDYNKVDQWTDTDVKKRISEILTGSSDFIEETLPEETLPEETAAEE